MFQPKTSTFSTYALIWVHYEVVFYFSQSIFCLFLHLNSARQNLVIELCRALKIIHFKNGYLVNLRTVLWLLNYWLFQKCKVPFLLLKKGLSIWAFKKFVRKQDWCFFLFVYIKVLCKNNCFLFINKNYNKCHQQMTKCMFLIYTEKIKCETFLYTKSWTLCKKSKTISDTFYIQKYEHFTLRIFHESFVVGIYCMVEMDSSTLQ